MSIDTKTYEKFVLECKDKMIIIKLIMHFGSGIYPRNARSLSICKPIDTIYHIKEERRKKCIIILIEKKHLTKFNRTFMKKLSAR